MNHKKGLILWLTNLVFVTLHQMKPDDMTSAQRVAEHIKEKIACHELKAGDRLPAERRLAAELGVGRAHVREALRQLEHDGMVRTYPQSGTVVEDFSRQQLDQLLAQSLNISRYDFYSLVHMRALLETEAARLCCINRTDADLQLMERRMAEADRHYHDDDQAEHDFAFHQAIAQGSHNRVLVFLLQVITPDILNYYHRYRSFLTPSEQVSAQHRELLDIIRRQDTAMVREATLRHMHTS